MLGSQPFKDFPGGDRLRRLKSLEVAGKRVFVRVDFNVPMNEQGSITDDTRISATLPTLNYLREKGARVICASHLGRPEGIDPKFTLEPIAERLGELTRSDVLFAHETVGEALLGQSRAMKEGSILLLENLRFHEGESKNSADFAYKLSQLCDIFVNDAFGTCHRAHASTAGLPMLVKDKAPGFLVEAEVAALSQLIYNPQRPLIAILGGSKVSDKIKVIEALMVKSSKIIIGGAMAYTFLRAKGVPVGNSRIEADKIALATKLLARAKEAKCEFILPIDHLLTKSFSDSAAPITSPDSVIPEGMMALDIGPRTRELFRKEIGEAKTIFWNGPLGVFEKAAFAEGTFAMARAIAELKAPIKICGGGDSVAAVHQSGVSDGFTHISTGGGASLEMIEGAKMPGLEALKS